MKKTAKPRNYYTPKQVKSTTGDAVWYYRNKKHLDVYVDNGPGATINFKICR